MKVAKIALAAMALGGAQLAFAQTCASPIEIQSDNNNGLYAPAGSTTVGGPQDDFPNFPGGIPSPGPDIVHRFVAQDAAATITLQATDTLAPVLLLLDSCDANSANLLQIGESSTPGSSVSITTTGLTNGATYYVVVTHHPDAPPANQAGAYTGTIVGQLPVELQSFSVD